MNYRYEAVFAVTTPHKGGMAKSVDTVITTAVTQSDSITARMIEEATETANLDVRGGIGFGRSLRRIGSSLVRIR